MTVCERYGETIRGRVRKAVHTIRSETAILPLFAVGHDRRASSFKPLDRVSNRILKERSEVGIFIGILTAGLSDPLDEGQRSWDAANWLGGYAD